MEARLMSRCKSQADEATALAREFKPTRLYIKRHKITNKYYFGKTTAGDPVKYKGSGKRWTSHIKKHGQEHVETVWCKLFHDRIELMEFAIVFSVSNNIVKSNTWLNLIQENGVDGGSAKGRKFNAETRAKMSLSHTGLRRHIFTEQHKKNMSESHKGTRTGKDNSFYGKTHSAETKERIRIAATGRRLSDESIAKRTATRRKNLKLKEKVSE
jgi:hypothetical protein